MRIFSENIFHGNLYPPFAGYVELDDNGIIKQVTKSAYLKDGLHTDGYYDAICPGFVNAHCHIELSHLKSKITRNKYLPEFIKEISSKRSASSDEIQVAVKEALSFMYHSGISAVVDICNSENSFQAKADYPNMLFINMIELFGLNSYQVETIMDKGIEIKKKSEEFNFETYITPHSTYSLSEDLFQSIMNLNESLQSIHFNETNSENDFFTKNQGELFDLMKKFRNENPINRTFKDPTNKIAQNLNPNATIALVHNTYTTKEEIDFLVKIFNKLFFIFCPNANLFIENKLPKFEYFLQHKVKIAIGTDSLASNDQLSIWEEISTIYKNSKTFSLHELIAFACGNGAKLIGKSNYLGLIKQGFKPGIVEVDLNFNRDAKRLI